MFSNNAEKTRIHYVLRCKINEYKAARLNGSTVRRKPTITKLMMVSAPLMTSTAKTLHLSHCLKNALFLGKIYLFLVYFWLSTTEVQQLQLIKHPHHCINKNKRNTKGDQKQKVLGLT